MNESAVTCDCKKRVIDGNYNMRLFLGLTGCERDKNLSSWGWFSSSFGFVL